MNLHPETRKELRQIIQQLKRLENRLLTRAGEFEGKADSGMQFMFPVTVAPALREAATSMRKTVDDIATARASLQAELNDRR